MLNRVIVLLFFSVLLAACVSTPPALQGQFSNVMPGDVQLNHINKDEVKWAGKIIDSIKYQNSSCYLVAGARTDRASRPLMNTVGQEKAFFACQPAELDNKLSAHQMITVTGQIIGFSGEFDKQNLDQIPIVDADVVHLWRWSSGELGSGAPAPNYASPTYRTTSF